MLFNKNVFVTWLLITTAMFAAFIAGNMLGIRFSLFQDLRHNEAVLVNNLAQFSHCKIYGCDNAIQELLVLRNDLAILRYADLVDEIKEGGFYSFAASSLMISVFLYSDLDDSATVETLRGYYKNMGCGIDGIVCKKTKNTDQ